MLCRFVNHDEMKLFLIAFLQSLANLLSISVMSKSRSLANFRTAVAHVVKPWWFNCTNSKNTFFASSLSGIWYDRLIYRNADIWHEVLGGSLPHSPSDNIACCRLNMQDAPRKLKKNFVYSTPRCGTEALHITAICQNGFYRGIEEVKDNFWREMSNYFYFTSHIK